MELRLLCSCLEQPSFGLNPFPPRARGVLRIQAPPPSAPSIIRLYKYMVRMCSTYVLYICRAHRAASVDVRAGQSVRFVITPPPFGQATRHRFHASVLLVITPPNPLCNENTT